MSPILSSKWIFPSLTPFGAPILRQALQPKASPFQAPGKYRLSGRPPALDGEHPQGRTQEVYHQRLGACFQVPGWGRSLQAAVSRCFRGPWPPLNRAPSTGGRAGAWSRKRLIAGAGQFQQTEAPARRGDETLVTLRGLLGQHRALMGVRPRPGASRYHSYG